VYGKAFSLFWFFPAPGARGGPQPAFFANNVAFRRQTFARFPFPVLPGTARGACLVLAAQLADAGVPIVRCAGAEVAHPPPSGLRHFVARGLVQGRDRLLRARHLGRRKEAGLPASIERLARNLARAMVSIVSGRRRVGLPLLAVPVAAAIATAYYALYFLGELSTHANPEFMKGRFEI
jgi:hypothetical protein